jgi:hypothetical protein
MGEDNKKIRGAGGTPGGIKSFVMGTIMAIVGGYLLMHQVQVHSGVWSFLGFGGGFGITLIPFLFGVAILFFNGKSIPGWFLTIGGFLLIIVNVIANLQIYFVPTSLFNTLLMLVLLVGGLALIFRSLQAFPEN